MNVCARDLLKSSTNLSSFPKMKQSFVLVMSLDSLVKEKNVKVLWITSIFFLTSILSLKYINKKNPDPSDSCNNLYKN